MNYCQIYGIKKSKILLIISLLIFLISLLTYTNTFKNDFVNWDDGPQILENPRIKSLNWKHILHIFNPNSIYKNKTTQEDLPIRDFLHAIDIKLWGENAFGYHLTNILSFLIPQDSIEWIPRTCALV